MKCGQCVAVCPSGAIVVEGLDPAGFEPVRDSGVSYENLSAFFKSRRSVRRYKKEPLPMEIIEKILHVAASAPTGTGSCSTGVIVVDSAEKLAEISSAAYEMYSSLDKALSNPIARFFISKKAGKKMVGTLETFVMPGFRWYRRWREEGAGDELMRDAPAVLLFTSPVNEPEGEMNCIIAAYQATLAAKTLGVGSCINGLLPPACNRSPAIRDIIKLSRDREVYACITLGFPKLGYKRTIPRKLAGVTRV